MKALALFLVLVVGSAEAGVEVGLGLTRFATHGDGVWYQQDYGPYRLNTSSASFSVGWRAPWWRVGYRYLGSYSTYCVCTSSDRAYEQLQAGNDVGWPVSRFYTRGDVHGLYASILPAWRNWYAELGLMYYGASNRVHVADWRPAIDDTYLRWGDKTDLNVSNGRRWAITPVVGVGYRISDRDSIALYASRMNVKGDLMPVINGPTWTLELRAEF